MFAAFHCHDCTSIVTLTEQIELNLTGGRFSCDMVQLGLHDTDNFLNYKISHRANFGYNLG